MSKITCILDACTIINLIHIDQDEFLIKKLKHLNVYLSEKVFQEVAKNVYIKVNKQRKGEHLKQDLIKSQIKEIDKKLIFFRGNQFLTEHLLKDLGKDFIETVKLKAQYVKDNGELHSTALAVYLSRIEPTKLFFHTDDYPAKEEFSKFFLQQQIGYIEDTADLLVLLYRLDDNFSLNKLDFYLSELFSEYASEVGLLLKKLRAIEPSKVLIRDIEFKSRLFSLIHKLNTLEFAGLSTLKDYFQANRGKYSVVHETLELHQEVFELESTSSNLLQKIPLLRKDISNVYLI